MKNYPDQPLRTDIICLLNKIKKLYSQRFPLNIADEVRLLDLVKAIQSCIDTKANLLLLIEPIGPLIYFLKSGIKSIHASKESIIQELPADNAPSSSTLVTKEENSKAISEKIEQKSSLEKQQPTALSSGVNSSPVNTLKSNTPDKRAKDKTDETLIAQTSASAAAAVENDEEDVIISLAKYRIYQRIIMLDRACKVIHIKLKEYCKILSI